MDFTEF